MSSPGSWISSGDVAPAAVPAHYDLRPLSTGEVLDRTFQLYRSRFALFAGLASLPAGIAVVFQAAQQIYLHFRPGLHPGRGGLGGHQQWGLITGGISLLSWLVSIVLYSLMQAAITWSLSEIYLGKTASIKSALAAARPRWMRYISVTLYQLWVALWLSSVLFGAAFGVWSAARASTGGKIAAGLLFFLAGLSVFYAVWAGLRVALSIPASVVESLGAVAAVRRSQKLLVDRKVRIFLLFLLLYALYLVMGMIQFPLALLFLRARGTEAFVTEAIMLAINFVGGTLIAPVSAIGLTLFYFDERVRREGFDIEWTMQRLPSAPESASAFPAFPESPGSSAAF